MTLKRLLLVSAASLAFLDSKTVAQDTTKPTLTLPETAKKCLPLLNAARQEADFVNLQESMEDKIAKEGDFDDGSFEGVLCDALLKRAGKEFKLADAKLTNGTYAFYELTDGSGTLEGNDEQIAVSDCSAAVEKWKGGFSLFGPSPPVKADFKTTDGFSFLTLYNPSASPQGQCKVATCTKGATQQETTKDKGYALVCLTSPSALTQDSIFS
ncbi:hypothetical protein Emed_002083 [Eimeria media]